MNARGPLSLVAILIVLVALGAILLSHLPSTVTGLALFFLVILETVVAPIPGGAVAYLGAATLGFWRSWPILYVGNVIGTAIVFTLARRIGKPYVDRMVPAKKRKRYENLLTRHQRLLWFVYAMPLFPLDMISILAGFTKMPTRRFLIIAVTALPFSTGMVAFAGAFLGKYLGVLNMVSLIVLGALALGAVWLWRRHH